MQEKIASLTKDLEASSEQVAALEDALSEAREDAEAAKQKLVAERETSSTLEKARQAAVVVSVERVFLGGGG